MPTVIVTAQCEDSTKWEEGFRTHGGLFRDMTVSNIQFTATDDNEIAIRFDVDNLDTYFEIFGQPIMADSMKFDGVKRDTVKVFVLDKIFDL